MASEQDDNVVDRDIDEDMSSQSLDEDDDVLEEDEEDLNAITIAIPSSSSVTLTSPNISDLTLITPSETVTDGKRHHIESVVSEEKRPNLMSREGGFFRDCPLTRKELNFYNAFWTAPLREIFGAKCGKFWLSEAIFERCQICGACFQLRCVDKLRYCIPGTSIIVSVTNLCAKNYGLTRALYSFK